MSVSYKHENTVNKVTTLAHLIGSKTDISPPGALEVAAMIRPSLIAGVCRLYFE